MLTGIHREIGKDTHTHTLLQKRNNQRKITTNPKKEWKLFNSVKNVHDLKDSQGYFPEYKAKIQNNNS